MEIAVIVLLVLFILAVLGRFRPRTQAILAEQVVSPRTPVYMFVCPERQIAEISSTVESLRVHVTNGGVNVSRSSDVSKISVRSKYQGNWHIEGNSIEQTHECGNHLWQSESGRFKLV